MYPPLFVFELFTRGIDEIFIREKEKNRRNERMIRTNARSTRNERISLEEEEEEYLRTREEWEKWRFLPRYSIKFHEIGRISADSCNYVGESLQTEGASFGILSVNIKARLQMGRPHYIKFHASKDLPF